MATISGLVRDKDGVPVGREVRLYRRDTGALIGATSSSGSPEIPKDPYFSSVLSFIEMDAAGAITDLAGGTLVRVGTPVITSDGLIRPRRAVLGSACYMHKSVSMTAGSDFTIEGFVSNDGKTSPYAPIMSLVSAGGTRATAMLNGSSGQPLWDGAWRFGSGALPPSSTLTTKHVAICKSGTTYRLFLDGALVSSAVWTGSPTDTKNTTNLVFGASETSGADGSGSLSFEQMRFTAGVARYAAAFTPLAGPLTYLSEDVPESAPGSFIFKTDYTGEVQVVCVDGASTPPLENDMIHRTFAV